MTQKEIWADIKGHEGSYQISNFGRVRSLDRVVNCGNHKRKYVGRIKKVWKCGLGYISVSLWQKTYLVHRLVAMSFLENPEGKKFINHKDFDRANNHYSNLEWCTPRENIIHASLHGKLRRSKEFREKQRVSKMGSKNLSAKLHEIDIPRIRILHRNGFQQKDIAYIYDVSASSIRDIICGATWRHV